MSWEVDAKASKRLSEIAEAAKASDRIILATDPDREGEAISWHVLDVLQQKRVVKDKPVERVVFNAITRSAVTEAMKAPRQIDMELVKAYLARRALDYLVGFNLSPVLWRKLPGARSAGRVQSVSLRLVVDREIEIERFITREYWTVEADMTSAGAPFTARLAIHEGRKLSKFDLGDEAGATAARQAVISGAFTITAVEAVTGSIDMKLTSVDSTSLSEYVTPTAVGVTFTKNAITVTSSPVTMTANAFSMFFNETVVLTLNIVTTPISGKTLTLIYW